MSDTITTARTERTDRQPTWTPDAIIQGKNKPMLDVPAVQAAVDDPALGRILLKGRFNFGDALNGPRKTVVIRRGVEIHGEGLKDHGGKITSWQTQIIGGGAKMPLPLLGNTYYAEGGAFKVEVSENKPVVFDGLEFRHWAATAILVRSCQGVETRNCSFAEPATGYMLGRPPGSQPDPLLDSLASLVIVTAIFAVGSGGCGRFVAEDNVCTIGDEIFTDDDQFIACELANFSQIRVSGNEIHTHDDIIGILCNGAGGGPSFKSIISITGNNATVKWRPGSRFSGSAGIHLFANQHAETEISGNQVNLTGYAIAFALSGENFTVQHNTITLLPLDPSDPGTYPVAAFMFGDNEPLVIPGYPSLGPSLSNSVVSNNHISGSALFGFFTYDLNDPWYPPPQPPLPFNESHDNTFNGNNTQHFTGTLATVYLSPHTHDNTFKGEYGTVMDLGTNNITGYTPRTGGIGPELSQAVKRLARARRVF